MVPPPRVDTFCHTHFVLFFSIPKTPMLLSVPLFATPMILTHILSHNCLCSTHMHPALLSNIINTPDYYYTRG